MEEAHGEESFWPAYVDILMLTLLVTLLLAAAFALTRKDDRLPTELARRKALFAEAMQRSFPKELHQGLMQLASPPGEQQSITFSDQLLFKPGEANLAKAQGRLMLRRLAVLLERINPAPLPLFKQLQINGHTDPDAIHTAEFPSNWHLSSARATSVLFFMVGSGLSPTRLSATGFGEHRPYTPDDMPIRAKSRKRRIELVVRYPLDWLNQELLKHHHRPMGLGQGMNQDLVGSANGRVAADASNTLGDPSASSGAGH